jgi:hypothetical protein
MTNYDYFNYIMFDYFILILLLILLNDIFDKCFVFYLLLTKLCY